MTVAELYVLLGFNVSGADKVNSVISGIRRNLGLLGIASGAEKFFGFVEHATEAATHLISMSKAMGMTVEQTQEWGYVAERSGSNMKELTTGMNMYLRNLDKFSRGTGGRQLGFELGSRLGFSQRDAKAALSSTDNWQKHLLKLSDALHGMTNEQKKATMTSLFGVRVGKAMLADFEQGSAKLQEMFARRRGMGELSEDQAKSLKDLGNTMKDVKISFSALFDQALAKMAPTLMAMAQAAVDWISANKEVITGVMLTALQAIAGAFELIADTVDFLGDLINDALGGDEGAQAILIGIAVTILSIVVPALWAMVAPIIIAIFPLLLLAAAVALVAYGILKLIKYGPEIKKALGDVWDWVVEKAEAFWDWLSGLPGRAYDSLVELKDNIIQAFADAWEKVKQLTDEALNSISEKIKSTPILGWIATKVSNAVNGDTTDYADTVQAAPLTGAAAANAANAVAGSANGVVVNAPITINGVKGAVEAQDEIGKAVDRIGRHAMRDVGGVAQ